MRVCTSQSHLPAEWIPQPLVCRKRAATSLIWLILLSLLSISIGGSAEVSAGNNQLTIRGEEILLNDMPIKLIGLRCSNAPVSDAATDQLINALDTYRHYGLNSIAVYIMGSRFGDVKGYRPNGELDPIYLERLERILTATYQKEMVVIVGCLYWGTSRAKEQLSEWDQKDANEAVANAARWLLWKEFSHVILDPDNEGMAVREKKWNAEQLIQAAKEAHPALLVANNTKQMTESEDLNIHFGPDKDGKPWLDSESTPKNTPLGGYWSRFSKETHQQKPSYMNYSRIGRYTAEMKKNQLARSRELIDRHNGVLLASTWIQCADHEGIGGPFVDPGGYSKLGSEDDLAAPWNRDIDALDADAGIRWWLEFIRREYSQMPDRSKPDAGKADRNR